LALGVLASAIAAAPNEIKLPAETAKLRPSNLPGYTLAQQKCFICHSVDYIAYQPPGMSQTQWTAEVTKMQHAFGAPLTDEEVKVVGAYLAVAYGSAKATDAAVTAASSAMPAAKAGAAGAAIDVQALLNANACLACHALDKRVVGPAYREVAAKYKGDANALAKVQASIRQGGTGKWGPMVMPPNAKLTDAQTKALAEFVLRQ
jgi:cytochrome c551/c552